MKKQVTVFGNYTVSAGCIVEKRIGSSWKNDYRYWFLVTDDGQEIEVADISSSKEKQKVISYLKNEITVNELIQSIKS